VCSSESWSMRLRLGEGVATGARRPQGPGLETEWPFDTTKSWSFCRETAQRHPVLASFTGTSRSFARCAPRLSAMPTAHRRRTRCAAARRRGRVSRAHGRLRQGRLMGAPTRGNSMACVLCCCGTAYIPRRPECRPEQGGGSQHNHKSPPAGPRSPVSTVTVRVHSVRR